jgi:hypothetical protein
MIRQIHFGKRVSTYLELQRKGSKAALRYFLGVLYDNFIAPASKALFTNVPGRLVVDKYIGLNESIRKLGAEM